MPETTKTKTVTRETAETRIRCEIARGTGVANVSTTLPFLDHMLVAFARYSGLDLSLQAPQAGRTGEEVHGVFEEAAFLEQDRLRVRGETDVFFGWSRERFVGAVAVARVGGVEIGDQKFNRSARQVILELGGDE